MGSDSLRADATYMGSNQIVYNIPQCQAFKIWLFSAVTSKLQARLPRFFTMSYRVFNLGICIPTLEVDARFLERCDRKANQNTTFSCLHRIAEKSFL